MTVGFFMPLPLAVMIPFMAGQSFAMGEAFGKGFQYGKRRISAMTNEDFNAMSAKNHFEETTADISAMIPSMKAQMNNFSTLQTDIIKTLIEQLKDAGITIGEAVASGAGDVFAEGPPGGTAIAQSSLDQLRSLVGLPPIYSKLVAPAGIAALFKFWREAGKFASNVAGALPMALNPSTWVFNHLKAIFQQNPSANTVTAVLIELDNASVLVPPATTTNPPLPSQEAPENIPLDDPAPNTLILDENGNVISSGDTRTETRLKAPSSIETQVLKLKEEKRIILDIISVAPQNHQKDRWETLYRRSIDITAEIKVIKTKYYSPNNYWG